MRQSLENTTTLREELELNLDDLALEKNNLIEQIKLLYSQREDIEQYLPSLVRQEQDLQFSYNNLKAELQEINYQKEEFERILLHQEKDIQENKTSLILQREEYRQLQEHITEIYHQKSNSIAIYIN
ncbi:MAG: hypothetical protein HC820_02050 [Hydrococcus sp. RM1_1_31]|nr:hypothetical protein [Hydrococcus sp. RM1_1_31]